MMKRSVAVVAIALLSLPAFAKKKDAVVVPLKTSTGQDAGTATFSPMKNGGVEIQVKLMNLPIGDHAVHIHQKPVCDAPDFKTAGGHFNPDGKQHGLENPLGHHNGDLGKNITIGENHMGEITYKVNYLSMTPGAPNSVFGTSIMVHEKPDDQKTDPTGAAGNRIACGVISAP
jgi:Cu-Zn family superoxide dismutase